MPTRRRGKHTHKTRKNKECYIYLRTHGGLNDNLNQLARCTDYAMKHGRSIILELSTYSATDPLSVFDFSHFPVPIYTHCKEMAKKLSSHPIEPAYYGSIEHPIKDTLFLNGKWSTRSGNPLCFDIHKSYPTNTVLIYACGGGGGDDAVNILSHIRLTPAVKAAYKDKKNKYAIPEDYISIHLRDTDRQLNITNNITGMRLKDSDAIIKMPSSGNNHADSLQKIDAFVKSHQLPVFVTGDNPKLIKKLSKKYPSILQTATDVSKGDRMALHKLGRKDPDNLKTAIIDLLILAGGKAIMTSQGGYSRLAKKLLAKPDILSQLLS